MEREGEHGLLSLFYAPPVNEGSAPCDGIVHVRVARSKVSHVVESERYHPTDRCVYGRHTAFLIVKMSEAVDPSVHVPSVVFGETEGTRKD